MYIPKSEFGWSRHTGWLHGDEEAYKGAVRMWANRPPGKERTRPIHESWVEILKHFDSSNPQRSQNAFCRWGNLNPASFSSWKVKPLRDDLERFILEWVGIFKDDE